MIPQCSFLLVEYNYCFDNDIKNDTTITVTMIQDLMRWNILHKQISCGSYQVLKGVQCPKL